MSRYQPSYREACEAVSRIEAALAVAREVTPARWQPNQEATRWSPARPPLADGFWVKLPRDRMSYEIRWPMSRIDRRCDDCGCALRARRDAGGHGFSYDASWLTADASTRAPSWKDYEGRKVCLPCLNRVRQHLRRQREINDNRLLINRINRELQHAA
jgi:hypothetical protein